MSEYYAFNTAYAMVSAAFVELSTVALSLAQVKPILNMVRPILQAEPEIAEGQGGISGGQRQRLLIARAIAPKPRILMFDEATSALDNITQKIVSASLESLKCTRIVIAHRLSTIKQCDRIVVLDKGHIIEDGTYDELIEKDGFFAELVARQQVEQNTDKEEE